MQKHVLFVAALLGIFAFADDASASHLQKITKKTEHDVPSQTASYMVPTTDPNVIYNHYTQAGGREIRTKDSYFAHCQVWVQTTISKSFANGAPRINPDNTYYPGDAFVYSFSYGWGGSEGCRNLRVCPVESNLAGGAAAKCEPSKLSPTQNLVAVSWSASIAGIGEISTGDTRGHFIQLTIVAERYFCFYPKKSKMTCGWSDISTTGAYFPNVIRPNTALTITQEYLKDADGFASGNLDKTYYLWDAINLVHEPAYKWKQERLGTITVLITKKYTLSLEKEFQCQSVLCDHTIHLNGFGPWYRTYRYGDGTTLVNATTNDDIKKHYIHYTLELLNLGRPIHKQENTTSVLVVRYDPAYDRYPYLVLKDGHAYSWGNRPAVALYYMGSYGGGQDDSLGVHEKRRSKINSFDYSGYAFDPILKRILRESLEWSESSQVVPPERTCADVDIDSGSFEGGKTNTAMFVKKGYGKIVFVHPILHTMLAKRFVNATIDNTLQSSDFAGYKIKNLTTFKYQYPNAKFGNPIKVLTYGSDGKRTGLPVSVDMRPDLERGAQYTHDYVCNKVLRDTKRGEFAEIVVNDMYDKTNRQNGRGYATLKSKLTSTWFPYPYSVFAPDVMNLDLNVGYGAPSPYEITMAVGEKTRTIKRIVNFLSPFTHVVNLDADNSLDVTSENGLLRIRPDEKFGDIVRVSVNGNDLGKDCMAGCTITATAGDLKIEAWNLWGGHATARLDKPKESQDDISYDWNLGMIAIFVAILGWLLHGLARQALNRFRNVGS